MLPAKFIKRLRSIRPMIMARQAQAAGLPPGTEMTPPQFGNDGLPLRPKNPVGRPAKRPLGEAGMFGIRRGTPRG